MQARIVMLSEIHEGNPTLCLSAKRYLGKCHDCQQYTNCESRIVNIEYAKKSLELNALKKQVTSKELEIKNLG